ncbi:hypothetical protein [Nonlabens ponticola]|uniref:Uncharacterized protein n=1 Tax=Nonlabens ponticola TaxID=2496866 RepID=A0A3S9N0M5_9FLAO|nr:hypothetical protein [Nonlabens ponticola]AZQ44967.1 hypothetical protein EJ995_12295 [Nonlabens ponticola]
MMITAIIITLTSCDEKTKTKQEHETKVVRDTSLTILQDLPIEIDSLDHIIHVVGEPTAGGYRSSYMSSESSVSRFQFSLVNSYDGGFSGKIYNMKFQKVDTDEITDLTNEVVLISSFSYLKPVEAQNQGSYFLYTVYDSDSNGDQSIETDDLKSLYLSNSDGRNFHRISPENEELIDWKYIKAENRVYYRTVEDSNDDGLFQNSDIIRYFYIDFDSQPWTSIEYN